MKLSESWLREWIEIPVNTEELASQLTMSGLEVDSIDSASYDFTGVVVGHILSTKPHPDADNLKICQVLSTSEKIFQVVCGASNVRQGIKVPFAAIGSVLSDSTIKKSKIRNIESSGMLCGADELGMSDESEGLLELPLDAPVGKDLFSYLKLSDKVIDIDLTPNRGDCLSIRGIAREVATLNLTPFCELNFPYANPTIPDVFPVKIYDERSCSRYASRIIRNIDISLSTPFWIQNKLRLSGIRSVDLVVDITNYVMLELGQPMHAFDLSKLEGGIVVRMAIENESLKLLDGSDIIMTADTLVIADQSKVIAMAGIMGGAESAMSAKTRDIFLESACFDPVAISGRSRLYGKHTDSSHRFERGVDIKLQEIAIERATSLLLETSKGDVGPVSVTESKKNKIHEADIILRKKRLEQQLGLSIRSEKVEDILKRLGLTITNILDIGWSCCPPSWRFDLSIEADLIEEIARIYGYENLPISIPSTQLPIQGFPESKRELKYLRSQLIARGYSEAITYSFVDPSVQSNLMPNSDSVSLINPISEDMSVMRTTLLSGLLPAVRHNLNRQQDRVRIFETGLIFTLNGTDLKQESMIAGAITGPRMPDNLHSKREPIDFFDLKGDVQSLLQLNGCSDHYELIKDSKHYLHPGQCARIERNSEIIGWLGQIHPVVQKNLGLIQPVFVFELKLQSILEDEISQFIGMSKFPEIRRDLAFVVNMDISAGDLCRTAYNNAGKILIDTKIFDVYEGEGIEINSKSIALGLTFRDSSRTLEDNEVNDAIFLIVRAIEKEHSGILRG